MEENSGVNSGNQDDNSFLARDYQVQLLSIAEKQNTILFLPTGSGKTFVAVMLIKAMSKDLEKPYNEGGKRTFFAVNTVALVTQQGDYIARHTHLSVGKYSGDLNVDTWSGERWKEELMKNQVIVLTCQILLDMLSHGFITLENINLIIFDECHHAVADHCMRRVMKKFENCHKEYQPRVLGLSATLLNSNCKAKNVRNEIENLEVTFQARVATVDNIQQVKRFSTNPIEEIIVFDDLYPSTAFPGVLSLQANVIEELNAARAVLTSLDSSALTLREEHEVPSPTLGANLHRLNSSPGDREKKRLNGILNDVHVLVEDLGVFAGYVAALYANILLHRRWLSADSPDAKLVISCLISHMTLIRKMIHDKLDAFDPMEQVLKFSTNKVLQLIELIQKTENPVTSDGGAVSLEKLIEQKKESLALKPCSLIFVERRQAAKTLYQVLMHISQHCVPLMNVKPEFVVGIASNPSSLESNTMKRRHHEAIKKFRCGECNYLVASDVMEEGIDIPLCSMVVKLDLPKTFRSYVQSKGRARHSSSKFFMFVPSSNAKFMKSLEEYRRVEMILKQILVGNSDDRVEPSEEEVKYKLYAQEIPTYLSDDGSASVNLVSAVPLINRYCSLLPQDKFTQLYPMWVLEDHLTPRSSPLRCINEQLVNFSRRKLAYLQLPINAPIRNIIKGIPMHNKRFAKRSVALIASVILHRRGELGKNDLLPVCHEPEALDDSDLFPNWIDKEEIVGIPGSKKFKRVYQREVAKYLSGSHPKPGVPTYVYHIFERPVYNVPSPKDSRGTAIYNVLNIKRGFAILSSKKLPQVCDFSLFMSSGEIDVRIEPEQGKEELILSAEEIKGLELFHVMLFLDLLNICKQFFVVDKSDTDNAYLIAPTCTDSDGKWIIDWDIVKKFSALPMVEDLSPEEKDTLQVDDENFLYEVVTPWYRGSYVERHYVVTQVCKDLSARSPFPSLTYPSFEDYFREKYELSLTHPEKPLLEVKAISSRIDCTHPKSVAKPFDDTPSLIRLSKRQMQLKNGDFLEHLVPELVTKRLFPSTLWLKATTLPTILHRFSSMQLASELRSQICKETKINNIGPPGGKWRRLEVEANEIPECEPMSLPSNFFNNSAVPVDHFEAPDLDHDIDALCLMDVVEYHKIEVKENEDHVVHPTGWMSIEPTTIPENVMNRLQSMTITDDGNCQGPELADVLSALTGASAGDVLSLERLETLGDSFLKFAVSTFLYLKYPMMDEGKLTLVKAKLISNRNLFYCGRVKKMGGKIKVHPFAPQSDWTPPGFTVPSFLKEKLNSCGGITKNILFQLTIPESERRSGQLSRDTMYDIVESLNESQTNNTIGTISTTLEALLGTQSVPDKSVADCVEAMIGAWLISGGCGAALRLLGWFGIFPHGTDGPAGTWKDLVGTEALDIGKRGVIKDQADYDVIGGVVDWGPNAERNTSVSQVSDKMKEISLFQQRKGNGTVIEEKREGDITTERVVHDSEHLVDSSDRILRIEKSALNKCNIVGAGDGKFSLLTDSDEESMDYCNQQSNFSADSNDTNTSNVISSKKSFDSEEEFDANDNVESWDEYDYLTDESEGMEPHSVADSEDYSEGLFDIENDCHDIDQYSDEDIDSSDEDIFYGNPADNCVPDKSAVHEYDGVHGENSPLGEDASCKRPEPNKEISGNSFFCLEKKGKWPKMQAESCSTPAKRRKLLNIPSSQNGDNEENSATGEDRLCNIDSEEKIMGNPSSHSKMSEKQVKSFSNQTVPRKMCIVSENPALGEVKSLPSNAFSDVDKKHEMGDASVNVEKFFKCINKSSSITKQKVIIYKDFEVDGPDDHGNDCMESINSLLIGGDAIEKCINYKFKNRSLLLQALTHASYYPNRITECYQRLEFLGDAVLDFVITMHIFETGGNLNPGQLTDLRSALVNNITFASLVVRHGLHRHLLHLSPGLMEAIDSFVEFQHQRDNAVTEDCLVLMEEEECCLAESVEVPKALGDILESLAGAIFLDSGLSLSAVWQVFYPMMKNEIQAFIKKVPKQPVRELLETNANVQFLPSEEVKSSVVGDELQRSGLNKQIVMVPVKVIDTASGQERTFYGFGERKSLAKRAAAKLALRAMGKGTKPQHIEKDA